MSADEPRDEGPAEHGESKLDDLIATRRAKVAELRDAGVEPYPVRFAPSHTLAQVHDAHGHLEAGTETGERVTVAGRVVNVRDMGKLRFLVLREDGVDLQLLCPVKALDEPSQQLIARLDAGDWVGAEGEVLVSKRGELSVKPATLTLLAKGLRPIPSDWYGLTDTEQRFRQRELDLVVNAEARRVFEATTSPSAPTQSPTSRSSIKRRDSSSSEATGHSS